MQQVEVAVRPVLQKAPAVDLEEDQYHNQGVCTIQQRYPGLTSKTKTRNLCIFHKKLRKRITILFSANVAPTLYMACIY